MTRQYSITPPAGYSHSLIYKIWKGMQFRCFATHNPSYHHYGGRGITVCDRWLNGTDTTHPFLCFKEDMGERPSLEHSIDRRNNDGNYSCGKCDECQSNGWTANCRWATRHEQMNNRSPLYTRMPILGVVKSLNEWCAIFDMDKRLVRKRLYGGWDLEIALMTPCDETPRTKSFTHLLELMGRG